MGKKIIPIGSTGFAAREIWDRVDKKITQYPYLEAYRQLLARETDINVISKAIVDIINSIVSIY